MPNDQVRVAFNVRQAFHDGERRGAQIQRFLASLAIGQESHAALKVDFGPFQVKDLAQTGAGQDKQAQRSDGMWVEHFAATVWLGRMFRVRFRFVDLPRQADRLGVAQRVAKASEFRSRQEALAPFLRIPFDSPCRIRIGLNLIAASGPAPRCLRIAGATNALGVTP